MNSKEYRQKLSDRTAKVRVNEWRKNYENNARLGLFEPIDELTRVREAVREMGIVIVGGGDSINERKNINALRECNRRGIPILAAEVSYGYLRTRGIYPLSAVNLDSADVSKLINGQ